MAGGLTAPERASRGRDGPSERNVFQNDLPKHCLIPEAFYGIEDLNAGQAPLRVVVRRDPSAKCLVVTVVSMKRMCRASTSRS
jgi:hypothetical protein